MAVIGTALLISGQSPAQMRQVVRAYLDSHQTGEKDKLKNDQESISKVIGLLKNVEGLEPEVTLSKDSGN